MIAIVDVGGVLWAVIVQNGIVATMVAMSMMMLRPFGVVPNFLLVT